MRYLTFIFSLLICISCGKKNWEVLFDKKEEHPYIEVNIKQLKKNYKEYDGKWVKVIGGLVNVRYERSVLQPRIKYHINDTSDIWVWYPNTGFGDIVERINKKEIIMKGFFTTSSRGHLAAFPGSLQDITYIAVYE